MENRFVKAVGENYGDIAVDTNKSHQIFKEWLAMTRPAPGPNGKRRPLWFKRAFTPDKTQGGCYYITNDEKKE